RDPGRADAARHRAPHLPAAAPAPLTRLLACQKSRRPGIPRRARRSGFTPVHGDRESEEHQTLSAILYRYIVDLSAIGSRRRQSPADDRTPTDDRTETDHAELPRHA